MDGERIRAVFFVFDVSDELWSETDIKWARVMFTKMQQGHNALSSYINF